jgi:hypothetical protein
MLDACSCLRSGLVTFELLSACAPRFHPRATKKVQVADSALVPGPACFERRLSLRLAT